MKSILAAAAAADLASPSGIVDKVLRVATERAKELADFLEELTKDIKEEEDDDLPM